MKIHAPDFNLEATLESGQVFGFKKSESGEFQGSFGGVFLGLRQEEGRLHFKSGEALPPVRIEKHLRRYFNLERDLDPVYSLLDLDPKIPSAWKTIRGLRLIRQDPWEAMACFILSSNNNIKRIAQMWRRFDRLSGNPR